LGHVLTFSRRIRVSVDAAGDRDLEVRFAPTLTAQRKETDRWITSPWAQGVRLDDIFETTVRIDRRWSAALDWAFRLTTDFDRLTAGVLLAQIRRWASDSDETRARTYRLLILAALAKRCAAPTDDDERDVHPLRMASVPTQPHAPPPNVPGGAFHRRVSCELTAA
jgi:hypothetical protein